MAFTTIDDSEAYFQVKLYSGTGSEQSITLDGDTDMQPNLVWVKQRSGSENQTIFDSNRGAPKILYPNITNAESAGTAAGEPNTLSSFDSDGFTVIADDGQNKSGSTYVAFCWKESATAGMDLVGYTGNGSARTISHSLSAVPHFMIVKQRSGTGNWIVYNHKNTVAPATDYFYLNTTASTADDANAWNDTEPTSSVFSVGDGDDVNENTETFIAHLWSEKQGFSKFDKFVGNGVVDGPFIHTGFRPAWIMIRNAEYAGVDWNLHNNKSPGYNVNDNYVAPNEGAAEVTDNSYQILDICSNGFKIRGAGDGINKGDYNICYWAFAEAPFVNSKGVPNNAR